MSHRSPITCVDHHIASGFRVTGGYDGRVVAWDQAGTQRWSTDFDDLVNDVRLNIVGDKVAVAVADGHAYVLDAETGHRVEVFGPHGDDVNAVSWSPDGRQVACVMDHLDATVRVWALASSKEPAHVAQVLDGHESGVFAASFDHDGRRLATVAEDSTARVWDIASGSVLHVLKHPGDPEAMDWSPDGRLIITGCDDGVGRVWNPDTGLLVRELHEADAAVRFVRFDSTGGRVMLGSYDATMRVYETDSWEVVDRHQAPFQWERSGAFTNDGVVIGSFGAEPIEHPAQRHTSLPLTVGINTLAASSERLLVGRDDGAVVDVWRGEVLARHDTIVNTVALSPSGTVVASGDYRGGIRLTPFAELASSVATRTADGGPVNSIVWHPDGQSLFSGGYDGCVRVWELDDTDEPSKLTCVGTFTAAHGPIKSLAWSAKANLLTAGSSDGSLSGWRDGDEIWRAQRDDMVLVNAVACADDAGTLVSASRDLHVRVWDAASGELLETLVAGHRKSVKAIAVTADGSLIVTGSYDGVGIVWRRNAAGWSWTPLRVHGKPGVPAVGVAEGSIFTAGWSGGVARWSETGDLVGSYQLPDS